MFIKEANGLRELAKANVIRVPQVICTSEDFLILENISQEANSITFWEEFGRSFAQLHKFTSISFGFYEDNYIGSTPQPNKVNKIESKNWTEFYFNNRLLHQYKLAEQKVMLAVYSAMFFTNRK